MKMPVPFAPIALLFGGCPAGLDRTNEMVISDLKALEGERVTRKRGLGYFNATNVPLNSTATAPSSSTVTPS
jgi:hypothetical protein